MSGDDLSQKLQRIRGFIQSSHLGESSTSTSHIIITRLDLTPSSKTKQEVPPTPSSDSLDHPEPLEMANHDHTLKELVAPDLDQQSLCIQYPQLEVAFELKSGMIHLLPTFHVFAGDDPNKHLKEFHVVCSSMKPTGISEEQVKLRAFPFSLADNAKEWLYYLPYDIVTTWNEMKKLFLEKYFPASKAANIRKEICGIRQLNGESLYKY